MKVFTHIDENNAPAMVDVGDKKMTQRMARAQGFIELTPEIMEHFKDGEISLKKGPVFHTAIIAGTNAAKETSRLIPFCHQINLESVKVFVEKVEDYKLCVTSEVKCFAKTGVEMEALSAVSIALLSIYDMCKGVSKNMTISSVALLEKTGGKSDWKK